MGVSHVLSWIEVGVRVLYLSLPTLHSGPAWCGTELLEHKLAGGNPEEPARVQRLGLGLWVHDVVYRA